jgi:hypothetical protein
MEYILVGQGDGGDSLFELASRLVEKGARLQVLYLMDSESETDWSTWIRKVVPFGEFFLTKKGLEQRLMDILSHEDKEVTTFIAGEEIFLRGMTHVCTSLGLEREQICEKVVYS